MPDLHFEEYWFEVGRDYALRGKTPLTDEEWACHTDARFYFRLGYKEIVRFGYR